MLRSTGGISFGIVNGDQRCRATNYAYLKTHSTISLDFSRRAAGFEKNDTLIWKTSDHKTIPRIGVRYGNLLRNTAPILLFNLSTKYRAIKRAKNRNFARKITRTRKNCSILFCACANRKRCSITNIHIHMLMYFLKLLLCILKLFSMSTFCFREKS